MFINKCASVSHCLLSNECLYGYTGSILPVCRLYFTYSLSINKFFSLFVWLQLLVGGGQTTTVAGAHSPIPGGAGSSVGVANAPSLSPGGSASGAQTGALSPGALSQASNTPGITPASGTGGTSCCENGRPIMTDPVSGQTVCSCQYDSARLALSGYSRIPAGGVYGSPYPSTDQNPYPSIGVDSSAFYSPLVSIFKHFIN